MTREVCHDVPDAYHHGVGGAGDRVHGGVHDALPGPGRGGGPRRHRRGGSGRVHAVERPGHRPGAGAGGDFPADIEIRYTLGRDDPGVYTYCTFEHRPDYPAGALGEARYCAKLADMFDWMTLDARRDRHFPADLHEGDKYI